MTERKVTMNCKQCGQSFQVIPSRLKHGRGLHCSPACQYASIKGHHRAVTTLHTCIGCGGEFERLACQNKKSKGSGKYCSRSCRDKHWRGPLNPLWQNGSGVYKRGSDWQAIRRRILKRDGVCRHCGSPSKLHVHHKIPFRMFSDADAANAESNLVALCPPCHRREDARHKWVGFEGGALCMSANGAAFSLARENGLL